jgi:uncharacterized protein (TIGR00725 family)
VSAAAGPAPAGRGIGCAPGTAERQAVWVSDERRPPYIAVVGPAEVDGDTYALAVEVGRLIAQRGAVLVCGGHGGVMEAAARGAAEHQGVCLGILPGSDRSQANRYMTMVVATGLGELRNGLVVRASDAVLAVGGSWGTLSEIAIAMRLRIPVVTLRSWSVIDEAGTEVVGMVQATSPAEAVRAALQLAPGAGA